MPYYMDPYALECENALDSFISSRDGVRKNPWKNAPFDWSPDKEMTQSELKTRYSVDYDDYPDLVIGKNKIREAKKYYGIIRSKFYFWFRNGDLYEWEYTPSVILEERVMTRNDREGIGKAQPHIPRELLVFVKNIPLPLRKCLLIRG